MERIESGEASQPSGHPPHPVREALGWAGAWAAVPFAAVWIHRLTPGWLAAAAAGVALWLLLARGVGRSWRTAVGLAFAATLSIGAFAQIRLGEVARDWSSVRAGLETRAAADLRAWLDELVTRGDSAVAGAGRAAARAARPTPALFARLEEVRRASGMGALAVYEEDGTPLAWAGEHRGDVPESVRTGALQYSFSSGPLFGYLYFTSPLPRGRTAVAAVLLDAHVAGAEGDVPFVARFSERHGITPRFTTPDRAQGPRVWDWKAGSSIMSVVFSTLTQEGWRARVESQGRMAAGAGLAVAALLLCIAWFRCRAGPPGIPVGILTASLLALPTAALVGGKEAFSPLAFVLPAPGDVTLGQLLFVLAGAAVWLLSRTGAGGTASRVPLVLRTVGAAALLAGAVALVRASVSDALLARHPAGGLLLVAALTLLAALPLMALLGEDAGAERLRAALLPIALTLAAALAAALVLWWQPGRAIPVWVPALWAIPFGLAAAVLSRAQVGRGALLPWVVVGWISASLALPHLWVMHQDARLREAERELANLGTRADPFLDFLLRQFAEKVLFYAAEGREGVSLLYQSWVEGGLAREGYEARVSLWEGDRPSAELRLSDTQVPPEMVPAMLASARAAEEPVVERYTQLDALHYLLVVPLPGGRTVSVAVPPRRHLGGSTALARLLDPAGARAEDEAGASLSLVPSASVAPAAVGAMRWVPTGEGWRSEAVVAFPSGPMHAHLSVRAPSAAMLAARALLAVVGLLVLLGGLWALARTLCGEPLGLASAQWGWLWTFRGRLTLALFAFFLLPMAGFGATTYRALSREVVRTAGALAERALTQAASEVQGATIGELGRHVGADLLLYHQGVLVDASSPEVIDLGLYATWLPGDVFVDLSSGEEEEVQEEKRRLAGHDYLLAYRRVAETDVLAAPTPLAVGEIARRRRELATLVLLAGLVGAALSVVLSLLVGRAFSRPIEGLSRAAAQVGGGDLAVRLPAGRRDEFGGVYRAFNRMVRRLRDARAALVRETRRTEAIVAEAGTGVIALDPAGRVQLINPRACAILGTEVAVGDRIPEDAPTRAAVGETVRRFLGSGADEGTEERETDGKVVRLRLRRLPAEGGARGAVLVLEDVTAEIRSARVLAWGEMARQVAHEIKNPLTPIKLSVQHIRRAHQDGRADFGAILDRNVEAVLREIDRLGEIARAFARFGTPADASAAPDPVDVAAVVDETLALYRGGQDGIRYAAELEPGLPPAWARSGELKEVLINLLENARAALHDQGEVRIAVGLAGGGEWVRVDVSDTGEGIPEESLARVFEPQFSTKSSGTGLGLAIVRRLVESWGGDVTVDSVAGEGTTVHLRLRAVDVAEAGAGAAVA